MKTVRCKCAREKVKSTQLALAFLARMRLHRDVCTPVWFPATWEEVLTACLVRILHDQQPRTLVPKGKEQTVRMLINS